MRYHSSSIEITSYIVPFESNCKFNVYGKKNVTVSRKKIMEDHGGKIWASSKEGVGTVMYLVLRKYQEVPVNE